MPKQPRTPSEIKSQVAQTKPRVGGRFVASPTKEAEKKQKEEVLTEVTTKLTELEQKLVAEGRMTDADREYIGSDSLKFFERALEKASTWYDAYKFAKELRPLQHPSYAAIQASDNESTHKVLVFELRPKKEKVDEE